MVSKGRMNCLERKGDLLLEEIGIFSSCHNIVYYGEDITIYVKGKAW